MTTDIDTRRFQGYYLGPQRASPVFCGEDSEWTTSDLYAYCCPTTAAICDIPTSCSGTFLFSPPDKTGDCGEGFSCGSLTVYQTSGNPFGGPSAFNYFCKGSLDFNTLFRELPTNFLTTSTSSTPSQSKTSETASPATTSSAPNNTGTTELDGSSPSSKAWIAGPVAGSVAAVAALGLVFWIGMKRGRRRAEHMGSAAERESKYLMFHSAVASPEVPWHSRPDSSAGRPAELDLLGTEHHRMSRIDHAGHMSPELDGRPIG